VKRFALVVMVAAVMVAMIATLGVSASAQSPCPPTGPSGGLATLVIPERPVGAGFVCLDKGAQEFFCPAEFELQLIPILPPGPGFIAECVELSSPPSLGGDVGSGGGGVELPQQIGQESQSGTVDISHNVSNEPG
jgi:hypothetical protein